jgi:hypothetical protein
VPEVDAALEELTHGDDGHAVVSLSFVPVIHESGRIAVLVPGACERTPPEVIRDCGGAYPSYDGG